MSTFDPVKYKQTTQQQWQEAAEAWHRWGPTLSSWLGPVTEVMLDMAKVGAGHRVLDVAAGAGEQTMTTARRVGPTGHVLATDISSNILEFAAAEAKRQGHSNVACQVLDGENLDVPEGTFDAVISRVGLIYFPDQQKALAGMKRALKPGGRVAAIVYSTPDKNTFFSTPVGIIRRRANLGPPLPGQPGPFSLGAPGVLRPSEGGRGAVRRRTRVIRVFPNEASLVRLTRALAQERNAHWLARRYVAPATDHAEVVIRAA